MFSTEERDHFERHGWFVVRSALSVEGLRQLTDGLLGLFPAANEYWAQPERFDDLRGDQFDSVRTVPTGIPALDVLPFSEPFRSVAGELTGTDDLRLLRAGYQAKFTGAANFDQVLHRDYGNHTLVVPPDGPRPVLVGFFVYFTPVTESDGPTMVVSKERTQSLHIADTHLERHEWPEIYDAEEPVLCDAGTLLAYDNRTFHRGTALTGSTAHRLSLSFAYGVAEPWHGFVSWPNRAEEPSVQSLVGLLSPDERTLLGFPAADDPYWTDETVKGVGRRYPGLDTSPYELRFTTPARRS